MSRNRGFWQLPPRTGPVVFDPAHLFPPLNPKGRHIMTHSKPALAAPDARAPRDLGRGGKALFNLANAPSAMEMRAVAWKDDEPLPAVNSTAAIDKSGKEPA